MPGRAAVIGLTFISTLTFLLIGGPGIAAAASPVIPMPDERFLTPADRAAALAMMSPGERRQLGHLLADGAPGLVVGHTRRGLEVTQAEDGTPVLTEIGIAPDPSTSALSVPNTAVAEGVVTGTRAETQLWMSFTVVRTRNVSPYEWQFYFYAQWSGQKGANAFNGSPEIMATAWAGGPWLHSTWGNGKQMSGWPCNEAAVAGTNADGAPNAGTSWEFKEWNGACLTRYFHTEVRVRQDRWLNQTHNVIGKYYHTYSNNHYSVTIGPNPSVTINPLDKQWSVVLWNSYRH